MIILDTNVVSEPLRTKPAQIVVDWLNAQEPGTLYLTSVTVAELLAGLEALPSGKRREALRRALQDQLLPLFEGRILSFDQRAAEAFAVLDVGARAAGHTISFADCAIAAIAASHRYVVATRNVRDFRGTNVKVLDPWSPSASG